MKQVVSNYSYSPATNVVTLTGVNIDQDQLLLVVAPQVGRTMYNFASGVTGAVSAGADTRITLNASTVGLTTTSPLVIFYDDQQSTQTVSGTVTISNLPANQAIYGTVTANVFGQDEYNVAQPLPLIETDGSGNVERELAVSSIIVDNDGYSIFNSSSGALGIPIAARRLGVSGAIDYITAENNRLDTNVKNSVTIGSLPAISGTVTVSSLPASTVTVSSLPAISGTVTVGNATTASAVAVRLIAEDTNPGGSPAGVNVNLYSNDNALLVDALKNGNSVLGYDGLSSYVQVKTAVGSSVTIGSLPTLTPQLPRVTFIDGSGTVTTANTAVTVFASSTTRSYLLVQVTTGSAFVNVGATATTVNGISLTAGQGYAWETTIPQGAVSLISTTTNSAYVAKQA